MPEKNQNYKFDKRSGKIKKKVRRVKTEEQLLKEEDKRKKKIMRAVSTAVFLTIFAVGLALIIAGYVFLSYITYGKKETNHVFSTGYEYVDGKNNLRFSSYGSSSDYIYGEQYVSVELLRDLDDIVLTGDSEHFNIFFDDKNTAKFTVGSTVAEVNGLPIILTRSPEIRENKHLIPFEFIKSSILGYEFTKSSNNITYRVQKNELYSSLRLVNISNKTSTKPNVRR